MFIGDTEKKIKLLMCTVLNEQLYVKNIKFCLNYDTIKFQDFEYGEFGSFYRYLLQ